MVPRQRATCRTPRLVCFGWIFLVGVRAVRVGEMRPARHWVAYSLLAERSVRVHLSRTCPSCPATDANAGCVWASRMSNLMCACVDELGQSQKWIAKPA